MSEVVSNLRCEGSTCGRRIVSAEDESIPDLEEHARVLGWTVGDDMEPDYCPECMADEKRRTGERKPK